MGCEITSVYADEVVGVIGYPQQVLTDLMKRDYSSAVAIKPNSNPQAYNVYGFTQSFAEGQIFTCVLNKRQYFVYIAGRFLMRVDVKTLQQKSLMHEDKIVCAQIKGKLCVTGSVGGKILIWDLQFLEKKIQVRMPLQSHNFSAVGLTNKYIFCVDSSQPKNNVFCYDLRTSKLKAQAYLGSFQPTLKGKSWGQNHFVTAAADGLWFSKFMANQNAIQITKGMFRIYPKTSMTCISIIDNTYLISGGVDGYVFLWAHYQCQRVLRASDSPISAVHLTQTNFIAASFDGNVKCFSFELKRKQNPDEDEIKNGQITDDFVSIVIDSYDKASPLQGICSSILDPSVYYSQTRNGILFDKMIPSAEYISRINSYKDFDHSYMSFNKDANKCVYDESIWLLYHQQSLFKIQQLVFSQQKGWLKKDQFISSASQYIKSPKKLNFFIPKINHIIYVSKEYVKFSEVVKSDANDDLKQKLKQPRNILKIMEARPRPNNQENDEEEEDNENPRNRINVDGIVDVEVDGKVYLIIFFNVKYVVLVFDQKEKKYRETASEQYDIDKIKEIEIEGEKVEFEEVDGLIELKTDETDEELNRANKIHCVRDAIIWPSEKGYISLGGETLIIHKLIKP